MTIAKKINRKKRNQKLFNKLMAFYFAIVSCSALGFISAFADDQYGLKGKNVSVLENVEVCTGLKNTFRGVGYFFLRILAEIVSDFEKAVDILLKLNLYDLIDKYFKIDTWGKNIAAAVCALALIFVAVLLIFNADKSRITDFGRGIIISITLIIALPVLIKALGELQIIGVDESKSLVGQEQEYVTEDGLVGRMSLGELLLCNNVIDVEESIVANKLVYLSELKGFRNNSGKILQLDYNRLSTRIKEKPVTIVSKVQPQQKFSNLTLENKIELCGVEYLNKIYNDGYQVALKNYEDFKNKTIEEKNNENYHVHLLSHSRWLGGLNQEYLTYIPEESAADYMPYAFHSDNTQFNPAHEKLRWAEYRISEDMVSNAISRLSSAGIIGSSSAYFNGFGGDNTQLAQLYRNVCSNNKVNGTDNSTINNTVKALESIKIKVGDYDYSVMEWLNVSNNRELYENTEKLKDISSQFTTIEDLEQYKVTDIQSGIAYAWRSIVTWGHADEYVYKYNFNFLRGAFELIIVAFCLLFAGLKVASVLFDIIFARLIAPIVIASDMHGSGRAKQMVQNLISSYLILITVVLLLRIYIMVLFAIKKDGSAVGNNLAAELMIMLGGAKFVIDGPDIIVKILGIDAGVKSGLGTIMGIRTAASMARGAAHSVSNVGHKVHKVAHTPQKVANNIGQRAEAYRNSRDSGHGRARAVGSFITNGGITGGATGRAFNEGRNATYSRNASTANRREDRQQLYNSGNSQQGGSSNDDGNTGGSSGAGGGQPQAPHGSNNNTVVYAGGGEKGEKGDTGAKGDKGDKGEQGIQGMQGQKGEQGEKGKDADEGFAQRERREEQMRGRAFLDDR